VLGLSTEVIPSVIALNPSGGLVRGHDYHRWRPAFRDEQVYP
jgi:hypothetical protein